MKGVPAMPATLYHYTCADHGRPGIERTRVLKPSRQLFLRRNLVWFTDLTVPDQWALGLTNNMLCCDRTQYRVEVTVHNDQGTTTITPWWYYARTLLRVQRETMEMDGLPMHWWVSEAPVAAGDIVATADLYAARHAVRTDTHA